MTNIELLTDFFETIWERAEVHRIDEFFLPTAETQGFIPDMSVRSEDFQAMVLAITRLVENLQVTFLQTISDGDWVAALVRADCVSRASGRPVTLTSQSLVRFQNGKIAEAHNHTDLIGFFTQLGIVPPDLGVRLLGGADAA